MDPAAGKPIATGCIAVILIAAAWFSAQAWRSTRDLGMLWDERTDLDIAAALVRHPIRGESPPIDASQMRLPMYVCSAVFAVSGRDDLPTARAVSVVAGAGAILVTAALAWRLFGPGTAAISALLLALSPYYLAFARIAMTEGDVFLALVLPAACLAWQRFLDRPSGARWWLAGVLLGCAAGAKAYAGLLIPVFAVCLRAAKLPSGAVAARPLQSALVRGLCLALALLGVAGVILGQFAPDSGRFAATLVTIWITIAAGSIALAFAARRFDPLAGGRSAAFAGMLIVAGAAFIALMPEHLLQPRILRELAGRLLRWDHRVPLALWDDHLRLYAGIVLLKATPLVGVLSAVGLIYAGFVESRDARWRTPALAVIFWIIAMCFLPLRQTFYLMGVYPLLMILTAAFMTMLVTRLAPSGAARRVLAGAVFVGLPLGWLSIRSAAAYPDYQLFPDDQISATWLGAEARGYRNLIQTNSDGVEQAIRWCMEHVSPGQRVVSFFWEDAIIARLLPADVPFDFVPRGVSLATAVVPPAPSTESADYVLLHVNNILGYGDLPPDHPPLAALMRDFEVAQTIRRGQRPTEVAWVYRRKPPSSRDGATAGAFPP